MNNDSRTPMRDTIIGIVAMLFVVLTIVGALALWWAFWDNWAHNRDEARKEAARCKFVDLGVTSKNTDRMLRCPHKSHTLSLAPFAEGMLRITCSCPRQGGDQ